MILGKNVETGEEVELDLKKLIRTRLLIQANSGGGKSWCGRRIMEQTSKDVQHIIIDTEGEFSTLREKYDYLLVGSEGEIPATIRTAELLPKKIMDMKLSVIIDLSEMSKSEKCSYIKKFVDALLRLTDRKYWTPLLVFIDEAHDFAPESTSGKAESKSAIIGLGSKGRKRRWAVVLMTQRSAKLSNDASAECNNKLTGLANIPTDRKKAAQDLGFTTQDQERKLRELEPGEMYCYGSAISREVIKVKIGPVFTTHEEDEDGEFPKPAKTPNNIKKLMNRFIDLPKEAEKELKDLNDYKIKVHELKSEIRKLEHIKSKPIIQSDEKALQRAKIQGFNECKVSMTGELNYLRKENNLIIKRDQAIAKLLNVPLPPRPEYTPKEHEMSPTPQTPIDRPQQNVTQVIPEVKPSVTPSSSGENITGGAMKMLKAAAMFYPNEISRGRMGAIAGLSFKSGTFSTYLAVLKRNGLIITVGKDFKITDEGIKIAGDFNPLPSDPEALVELWMGIVKGGAARMLRVLANNYPNSISREQLGKISSTSGTFSTYLATLKRNELITVEEGQMTASSELFL